MPLDPNRWTKNTTAAFQAAAQAARDASNPEVTPNHLLLAMLGQADTVTLPVLQRVGVAPAALRSRLVEAIERLPHSYGGSDPQLAGASRDVFERADQQRQSM